MANLQTRRINAIIEGLDALAASQDKELSQDAPRHADKLLAFGEAILEIWLAARNEPPTTRTVEGFRLLALHRQGARGEPSFNACRETCRELVYHYNLVRLDPTDTNTSRRLRLGTMLARHLALFVCGKIEVSGLGEFCCSSRPLREREAST